MTAPTDGERATAYGRLLGSIAGVLDQGASEGAKLAHIRRLLESNDIHAGQVDRDGQPMPLPHDEHCQACGWYTVPPPADVRSERDPARRLAWQMIDRSTEQGGSVR